jgi:hypothetical protein
LSTDEDKEMLGMATERQIRRAIRQSGLDGLTVLCRESWRIEKALYEAVMNAREAGYTWQQIGHSIGMSKQGAWRRFNRGPLAERGRSPSKD